MNLTIVIPIFNEEDGLAELKTRLCEACTKLEGITWSVLYVNDGSTDRTAAILEAQHAEDPRFSYIEFSRNFGHQAALSAGLHHADADAVIMMDGDLQDPPEVIPELVKIWQEGAQVVIARYRSRQDKGLRGLGFKLFHRFFEWISDFPVTSHAGIFGLLDRQAHGALKGLQEKNRFLPGLRSWVGFDQRTLYFDRQERASGKPKQSFSRLAGYAFDAIFSFSNNPKIPHCTGQAKVSPCAATARTRLKKSKTKGPP